MQLRSGKQIGNISPSVLLRDIYLLDDIRTMHGSDWFTSKVDQTTITLDCIIDGYSDEKLASIDTGNKWLRIVYLRAVKIIYTVIEISYSDTAKLFTKRTKCALIRVVEAAHQIQLKVGRALWTTRNTPHIRELMMDEESDDAEHMYRTLRHIISDESIAYDYNIYSYNDGEYSDEETWDYYFGVHTDYQAYSDPHRFMNQVDACMEGPIRHWNMRMLE